MAEALQVDEQPGQPARRRRVQRLERRRVRARRRVRRRQDGLGDDGGRRRQDQGCCIQIRALKVVIL